MNERAKEPDGLTPIHSFTPLLFHSFTPLALKLWQKEGVSTAEQIERFTVGRDREMDLHLAPFDVLGNLAHAQMLETIGLLSTDELGLLTDQLKAIYR